MDHEPTIWWITGPAPGCILGFAMGWVFTTKLEARWWTITRLRLRAVFIYAFHGLVLGAVSAYIMSWLGPILPDWPARFLAAGIIGASVGAAAPGPSGAGWLSTMSWRYGVLACLAALISTGIVRQMDGDRAAGTQDFISQSED